MIVFFVDVNRENIVLKIYVKIFVIKVFLVCFKFKSKMEYCRLVLFMLKIKNRIKWWDLEYVEWKY